MSGAVSEALNSFSLDRQKQCDVSAESLSFDFLATGKVFLTDSVTAYCLLFDNDNSIGGVREWGQSVVAINRKLWEELVIGCV